MQRPPGWTPPSETSEVAVEATIEIPVTVEVPVVIVEPPPPQPPPPPPEPPPPPPPEPPPPPSAPSSPLHGYTALRLELQVGGPTEIQTGGSATLGLRWDEGWSLGLVLGVLSDITREAPWLTVALEAQRDFSPEGPAGFLLLARVGTEIGTGRGETLTAPFGQLGIGGRFGLGGGIAILVDLRGVLGIDTTARDGIGFAPGVVTTFGLDVPL